MSEEDDVNRFLDQIARAVVWLARKGLLYTGLKANHVRVLCYSAIKLIDYDECVLIDPSESHTNAEIAAMLMEYTRAETRSLLERVANHISSMHEEPHDVSATIMQDSTPVTASQETVSPAQDEQYVTCNCWSRKPNKKTQNKCIIS
jgi:hypothetical protein